VADHIVDTNVLLVASAVYPYSPFDDSDVPLELQEQVLEWLIAFRADTSRQVVWDSFFTIYNEYRHQLTDEDLGLMVVTEKMETARFIDIETDAEGRPAVPEAFRDFDPSDRKFLATLLADDGDSTLVNATDTDWLEIERELEDAGHTALHLLEDWLRAKFAEKKG
jgi:hypothetical protein